MSIDPLAELERMLAAEPSEWHRSGECSVRNADGKKVATTVEYDPKRRENAADLIVALHNNAPALIARLRELEKRSK